MRTKTLLFASIRPTEKLACLMFLAFAGCSSSSTGNAGGSGGTGGYMAPPTVHESAAPACNDAPELASPITHTGLADKFPSYTATGGTIADGVYEESSNVDYGFASSNIEVDATTVIVKGSTWYIANQGNGENSGNGGVIADNRSAGISGSTLTLLSTCTQSSSFEGPYDFSATDDGFTLYDKTQRAVIQFTRK